jgi:hypothetical protein
MSTPSTTERAAAEPRVPYRTSVLSPEGLPLCIEPAGDDDVGRLCAWLRDNAEWVQDRLTEHGAILFRGFPVFDAATFERVARGVDDELKNEYLGTSPRNGLTDYVFTASELPPFGMAWHAKCQPEREVVRQRYSGFGKSKRQPASHFDRWLPWA